MERKECKVVDERLMSVMDNSSVKAIFILTCAHCDAFILKCWTSYKNEQLWKEFYFISFFCIVQVYLMLRSVSVNSTTGHSVTAK